MRPGQLHRVLAYVQNDRLRTVHVPPKYMLHDPCALPLGADGKLTPFHRSTLLFGIPTYSKSTPDIRIQLDAYRISESYSSIPRTGQQQPGKRPAKRGQPQTKDLPTPPLGLCTQLAPPSAPCSVPAAAALHSSSHCSIAWLSILLTWRRIVR